MSVLPVADLASPPAGPRLVDVAPAPFAVLIGSTETTASIDRHGFGVGRRNHLRAVRRERLRHAVIGISVMVGMLGATVALLDVMR